MVYIQSWYHRPFQSITRNGCRTLNIPLDVLHTDPATELSGIPRTPSRVGPDRSPRRTALTAMERAEEDPWSASVAVQEEPRALHRWCGRIEMRQS